jgi:opacity protein-like surface antigen
MEVEARDLNYDRTASEEPNLRQDTAGGGVIYSWRHFAKFRPYAKLFAEYGNTDYGSKTGPRGHDSRNFLGGGGGVEYRIMPRLWVRADYDYQSWPDFFKSTVPAGRLNPQGFTVGAIYHFSRPRFH